GGMKSSWRDYIKESVNDNRIVFYDPTEKSNIENQGVNSFVCWDLHHIKKCDTLFIYLEADNPSCIGASVEAGYAKGLGKTVLSVIEDNNHIKSRYLDFLREICDIVFDDLDKAVLYINETQ